MHGNVCDVLKKSESLIKQVGVVKSSEQAMVSPLLCNLLGPEEKAINVWKKAGFMLMSI